MYTGMFERTTAYNGFSKTPMRSNVLMSNILLLLSVYSDVYDRYNIYTYICPRTKNNITRSKVHTISICKNIVTDVRQVRVKTFFDFRYSISVTYEYTRGWFYPYIYSYVYKHILCIVIICNIISSSVC